MKPLSLSTDYIDAFFTGKPAATAMSSQEAHILLQNKTCLGADMLGWVDLPDDTTKENIRDIQESAESL